MITFLRRVLSEPKASSASSNSVIFHELELQMLAYCPQLMFLSIYRRSSIYKWSSSWFDFTISFNSLFPYAHFSSGWLNLGNPTNIILCMLEPELLLRIELPTRVTGIEGLLQRMNVGTFYAFVSRLHIVVKVWGAQSGGSAVTSASSFVITQSVTSSQTVLFRKSTHSCRSLSWKLWINREVLNQIYIFLCIEMGG